MFRWAESSDFRKRDGLLSFQFPISDKLCPNLPLLPGLYYNMGTPGVRENHKVLLEQRLRSLCHLMGRTWNKDKGVPVQTGPVMSRWNANSLQHGVPFKFTLNTYPR